MVGVELVAIFAIDGHTSTSFEDSVSGAGLIADITVIIWVAQTASTIHK